MHKTFLFLLRFFLRQLPREFRLCGKLVLTLLQPSSKCGQVVETPVLASYFFLFQAQTSLHATVNTIMAQFVFSKLRTQREKRWIYQWCAPAVLRQVLDQHVKLTSSV